jgi:glycosyltransferase involved in cell wall biosynthesis
LGQGQPEMGKCISFDFRFIVELIVSANTKPADDHQTSDFRRNLNTAGSPHVLTLAPFYPSEGDTARGCFVAESLKALEGAGIRNTVIAVQPFYRGKVRPNSGAVPASWRRFFSFPGNAGLPSAGSFLFASLLSQVRTLHRRQPLDLIHAHAALPCGHAAALLSRELGIPFVVTVHGLDAFFNNQVTGYLGEWCKRVSVWVYQSSAKTICISEKVRNCVLNGVSAETAVVYNGVDTELFSPAPETQPTASILCIGNLIPIKGQELLLRAFAAVRRQFPKLECELIGDGPERAHLEALARTLEIANCVYFRGRQSRTEVATAMARCTLFALPSRYEGLGCVYLEAMASGKPVIACMGQGIEEIIEHGRNGWLTEPDDLPALVESLTQLLGNDDMRSRIGQEARRTVLDRLTLAHQADTLKRIYCEQMA